MNLIGVCLLRDLMSVLPVLETLIRMVLILPKVTSQMNNVMIEWHYLSSIFATLEEFWR